MALFWFDAKAGIALFQFWPRALTRWIDFTRISLNRRFELAYCFTNAKALLKSLDKL